MVWGEEGPLTDFILMNAAAAVKISGLADTNAQAMDLVKATITNGKALQMLNDFIE